MDSPADTKIQPDVPKLSEALKVLSEELPRISNLESTATLSILQGVQDELCRSVSAQNELHTLLDSRLARIQDTLTALENRIGKVEQPGVSLGHAQDDVSSDRQTSIKVDGQDESDSIITDTYLSSGSNPAMISSRYISKPRAQGQSGILQGGSGAMLIIIVSFVPILAILFYSES